MYVEYFGMKLAVIETGGKQYVVTEGDVIRAEKISDELNEGDSVTFDRVLLSDDGSNTTMGQPTVDKASVSGKLLKTDRLRKTLVERFRAKSRHHRKKGHRQPFSDIEITKIS